MLLLLPLFSGQRAGRAEEDGFDWSSGMERARGRRPVEGVDVVVSCREVWEFDVGKAGGEMAAVAVEGCDDEGEERERETAGQIPEEEEEGRAPEEDGGGGAGRAGRGERGPTASEDLDQRDQGHDPEGDGGGGGGLHSGVMLVW